NAVRCRCLSYRIWNCIDDRYTGRGDGRIMELVTIILSGILIASATYLILSKSVLRIIIGVSILSHGVHLMILTMGQLKRGNVPVLDDSVSSYSDPLPQALILTAIVISFALTAYSLVLLLRNYKELGTDNTEDMKGVPHDD